jgi:hypothetical protein
LGRGKIQIGEGVDRALDFTILDTHTLNLPIGRGNIFCEISGSHCGEYEDESLVE